MNTDADVSAHGAPFEAAVHWGEDGSARVVVAGDLDISTAPQLHVLLDEVIAKGRGEVHLDVAGLRFCAAAGISELLRARRSLAESGRRLVLIAVPEQIARTIRLAECDSLLDD